MRVYDCVLFGYVQLCICMSERAGEWILFWGSKRRKGGSGCGGGGGGGSGPLLLVTYKRVFVENIQSFFLFSIVISMPVSITMSTYYTWLLATTTCIAPPRLNVCLVVRSRCHVHSIIVAHYTMNLFAEMKTKWRIHIIPKVIFAFRMLTEESPFDFSNKCIFGKHIATLTGSPPWKFCA